VLNELVASYGATVVLSTATQPSLEAPFPEVRGVRQIVPEAVPVPPPRVRVEIVEPQPVTWPGLAEELAGLEQVLAITHRREDAGELTKALDAQLGHADTIHLSALMCPAHRLEVFAEIRERLGKGMPCRVVSTQLVEAGVDLDFPVVYRALGGVDAMIQAAGRANREGTLGDGGGLLRIYKAPSEPPRGLPRLAAETASLLLLLADGDAERLDLFSRQTAEAFFCRYYDKIADMDQGIRTARLSFRYREVDRLMRFIADDSIGVVIPYDEKARRVINDLRLDEQPWRHLRQLQRYVVTVYPNALLRLYQLGSVEPLLSDQDPRERDLWVASTGPCDPYDHRFGLNLERA
jgi:CRISPR-associated endonuclease/helicase Cas3